MKSSNHRKSVVAAVIALTCPFALVRTALAGTIYVDECALPAGDGQTWATAFNHHINILGASGNGTSTTGRALSTPLAVPYFDSEPAWVSAETRRLRASACQRCRFVDIQNRQG